MTKTSFNADEFKAALGRKIRAVEELYANRSEAAAAAGVSKSTLQNWIEGRTDPTLIGLARLCEGVQVSLDAFVSGISTFKKQIFDPALGTGALKELNVSLGHARSVRDKTKKSHIAFDYIVPTLTTVFVYNDKDYFESNHFKDINYKKGFFVFQKDLSFDFWVGIDHNLAAIKCFSDNMEPSVYNGDCLIFNPYSNIFDTDGLYLIEINNKIALRRIQLMSDGKLFAMNDNPNYENEEINLDNLRVIGKILSVLKLKI